METKMQKRIQLLLQNLMRRGCKLANNCYNQNCFRCSCILCLLIICGCSDYNRELRTACSKGDIKKVKRLINDKKVDINKQAISNGPTPLILASEKGFYSIVDFLISKGCDVNKKDGANFTALYLACTSAHPRIVKLLLTSGANPNVKTNFGKTPLMTAVCNDDLYIVNQLLKFHANVNDISDDGLTALDYAMRKNRREKVDKIIDILKKYGAKTVKQLNEK